MVAKINNMIYRPPIPLAGKGETKQSGVGIVINGNQPFFMFDNFNNGIGQVDGNMHPYAKAMNWDAMLEHCPLHSIQNKTPVHVFIDHASKLYGVVAHFDDEGHRVFHS